jgi:hypothetical protein
MTLSPRRTGKPVYAAYPRIRMLCELNGWTFEEAMAFAEAQPTSMTPRSPSAASLRENSSAKR